MKRFKIIFLFIFTIIVIIISFNSKYNSLINEFESTSKSKAVLINENIEISVNFISGMTIVGDTYFQHIKFRNSELMQYLKYDTESNSYNLDAVYGTKYEKLVGNLTGNGTIPNSDTVKDELNLAFLLNDFFYNFYNRLDDVAWLYYTSENDFINLYPWVPSSDFTYAQVDKNEVFYRYVTPQNDPLREFRWTPVYLDQAGKGFMVTLSSPIYNGDTFMGVLSVDFTNKRLSDLIISNYHGFLIDGTDTVIASNHDLMTDTAVIKLNTLMDTPQSYIDKINDIEGKVVQRAGKYFVYSESFNDSPWKLIVVLPVWQVIGESLLFILPVLLVCVLLFFTVYESDKLKNAETLLKDSIIEIKSYQNFLENAAKYDFLTNTVNRRGLKEIIDKKIDLNSKNGEPLSFIIGDIDHFKIFNDTYGHAAGDRVLIEIAVLMQKNIESNGVVCRWGGEEFVIMLPGKTCENAVGIAENIRKKIEDTAIPWEKSAKLRTTMTFGVAEYEYDGSMEACISKADNALYAGKDRGRNQVVCYKEIGEK